MDALQKFDKRRFPRADLIELLIEYQSLFGSTRNYATEYETTLRERPWKDCDCAICKDLGINVVIFRGAERNRRTRVPQCPRHLQTPQENSQSHRGCFIRNT